MAISIGSNVLMGVGDGLKDSGRKPQGHLCDAIGVSLLAMSPVILHIEKGDWYKYGIHYLAVRFMVFDLSYNITRGLPLFYAGNTSLYDKSLKKMPPMIRATNKSVGFIVGISLAFECNKKTRYINSVE